MPNKRIWSDEQLIVAVKNSICIADVIRYLGFKSLSRNYDTIKSAIVRLNLDVSHFDTRAAILKNTIRITEDSVFVFGKIIRGGLLKKFLKKYVPYECSECGIKSTYNNKPIVIQLDHIDGNKLNNLRINLRFLCPNCHSQTDTFCGRNSLEKVYGNICKECGTCCKNKFCSQKCSGRFHYKISGIVNSNNAPKIIWPEIDTLKEQVLSYGYTAVSKSLGVSLTAIKKHLKIRGAIIPAYWTQKHLY